MSAAKRGKITFAGDAAVVVGDRMVQIAPGGGPTAAVVAAGGGAGADDPLQGGAGPVVRLGGAVVAAARRDRLGGHADLPGTVADGVGAAGRSAAIAKGAVGGAGESHVPAGGPVPGGSAGQRAGGVRVQRAVPAGFAGPVSQPEQGDQRDGEIN